MRMRRGYRRLHIDEAEISFLKHVAHVRKKRAPSLGICGVGSRGRRSAHRLMRNHIAPHCKTHLRKFMRIRCNNRSRPITMSAAQ